MPYIYEAMDKTKEQITANFKNQDLDTKNYGE